MLEVRGFRAYRFSETQNGTYSHVWTPPYDVINPEERAQLAAKSPHNMVHVILPEDRPDMDRYAAAGSVLESWIAQNALVQDDSESFYLLEQRFRGQDGADHVRRGFFAVVRIPEPGEKIILGHENTFPGPLADRRRLITAVQADLDAVFVLYSDPEGRLSSLLNRMDAQPVDSQAVTIEGVEQRVWRIPYDPAVTDFFRGKRLYIADGHHRFGTACAHRDAMREKVGCDDSAAWNYVLMGFVEFNDPGLMIYPPHRLLDMPAGFDSTAFLNALEPWFDVSPASNDFPESVKTSSGCTIGLVLHGVGRYVLRLKAIDRVAMLGDDRGPAWRDLDVAVLHRGILERILGLPQGLELVYERDAQKAVSTVERGEKGLGFILNATRAEQVRACAQDGEPMPQKSTYFFPKLPAGPVIYKLM